MTFIEQTGTNNPFNGINVGRYSTPTLADIDGDGDLDAVVGEVFGTLNYYKNTGSASNPVYTQQFDSNNPFNGIDVGEFSDPTLADIDGDGDLDAVVGEGYGTLNYYKNTGSASNPVYAEQTGSNNPFNGIDVGDFSRPTLADLDGDGDLDAVVGEGFGTLKYYKNTGSASNPVYTQQFDSNNPFNGIDVGLNSAPTLVNLDGDGDLDAVVGEGYGTLKYYKNTGSASNPVYAEQTGSNNPFNGIDVGDFSDPTLADIDGDGDLDAVVGGVFGTLHFIKNVPNRPPNAVNDRLSTNENTVLNGNVLVANPTTPDSDPDNNPLTVTAVNGNAANVGNQINLGNGKLTVNADGTFTFDPTNGTAAVTDGYDYLAEGATATESFNYTVGDGNGGTASATAIITIIGVNDAPIVTNPVTATASEDELPFSVNLLTGASDPDTGDTLSVSDLVLTSGDNAGITVSGNSLNVNPSAYNSLRVGQSSVINYSYNVTDDRGGTIAQTATITITGVNDAPVAVNDNNTTNINTPITIPVTNLLANDSDVDSDPLSITSVLNPSNGTATLNNNGTPDNPNDDKIVFTPTNGFTGNASFDYTVSDGSGETATANVAIAVQGNFNGTPNPDTLIGTPLNNSMNGLASDDFIDGKEGNDTLDGGTGNLDRMFGGDGNDTILDPDGVNGAHGGTGNDLISVTFAQSWDNDNNAKTSPRSDGKITGGFGDDNLTVTMNNSCFFINLKGDEPTSNQPNDGNDVITLLGTYANSVVDMGGGRDTFNGGNGRDNVSGQNGDDILNGNSGNDVLNGGAGNDTLLGGAGNDSLTGGDGDDLLTGGLDSDTLNGGLGSDRFIYNTLADRGNLASGDTIKDFSTSSDIIDLTRLMFSLAGYNGDATGYLRFTQSGSNALLQIDADGGGNSFVNLATLTNVSASALGVNINVLV